MGGFTPPEPRVLGQAGDAVHRVPGKSTRTAGLPPSQIPLVEHGTVCDREPEAAGCGRTPQQRVYLVSTLAGAVGVAMANFRDAIQDARIDLLLEKPAGAGVVVEILLGLAMNPAIALGLEGALRALPRLGAGLAQLGA